MGPDGGRPGEKREGDMKKVRLMGSGECLHFILFYLICHTMTRSRAFVLLACIYLAPRSSGGSARLSKGTAEVGPRMGQIVSPD